eukprot:CAMPEP_0197309310 /NCGR_PEP_ID=MMETSP0891-20130614/7879_1 /TAXON_ID=44058 ORGANISM="Aureoumbra lagunensis, Strain CCMP1510" /NCGR_SAMPLE_ID=MMETSP0891 /ASSEMBLY_ACC=CAM_ASM_000534 /LENGTH=881 /DNA_ID=CAMNT_0042794299 /DNA_START=311 /DNA_END=2956 /DNA_ORIENTATION=-
MAVEAIFAQQPKGTTVSCALMEVYNEEVRDLLGGSQAPLTIRDGSTNAKDVTIVGLTERVVNCAEEVFEWLARGAEKRKTASTDMNARSSRSHMITTFKIRVKTEQVETVSKLHLVDLAGSERAKRTGATGDRLKEGIGINKSLLALGNVVAKLVEISETGGALDHVPYRDSSLTRVLADSLGGSALSVMLACISPATADADESANTLRWAGRAAKVSNAVAVNVVQSASADVTALRRQLAREASLRLAAEDRCRRLDALNRQLSKRVDVLRLAVGDDEKAATAEAAIFYSGDGGESKDLMGDDDVVEDMLMGDDDDEDEEEEEDLFMLLEDEGRTTGIAKDSETMNESNKSSTTRLSASKADLLIASDEAKLESLKIEQRCMENLRVHYEAAISKLEREVAELEKERKAALNPKPQETTEVERRLLREKTRELEQRLSRLRAEAAKASSEAKKCEMLKRRAESEASRLRAAVDEARRKRGELQKALQTRDAAHAARAREWQKQSRRLRRDRDRLSGEKRRMAEKYALADRTRARQLAQTRAQLKRLRKNYAPLRAVHQSYRGNSTKSSQHGRQKSNTKSEPLEQLPHWLEEEIDRRAREEEEDRDAEEDDGFEDRVRRLEELSWQETDTDAWHLLDCVCQDLARNRAVQRAARASLTAKASETRMWLQNDRAAYRRRLSGVLGDEALLEEEDDQAQVPSATLGPPPHSGNKSVMEEYSARCQRIRKSVANGKELEAVADKLKAVKSVVSDLRAQRAAEKDEAARLLRDQVKRDYNKPWLENAAVHENTTLAITNEEDSGYHDNDDSTSRASSNRDYDRPWRTNTHLPVAPLALPPPAPTVEQQQDDPPACRTSFEGSKSYFYEAAQTPREPLAELTPLCD